MSGYSGQGWHPREPHGSGPLPTPKDPGPAGGTLPEPDEFLMPLIERVDTGSPLYVNVDVGGLLDRFDVGATPEQAETKTLDFLRKLKDLLA